MANRQRWRPVLFDCPRTGEKVQGMIAEEAFATTDRRYEAMACLACAGIHFFDPASGNILGGARDG